ncbi:hypothetical protein [Streptomyces corynorhini]|uniref:hypothetical protein n=1 Tax=Streptomyces corynorhini TaxID=2282652 RepID=UPI00131436BE|nr:hypothetical protein [Streptomyces corynorhini]
MLLDEQQRLMLCGGCCGGWTVPQIRMTNGADFRATATAFLTKEFGLLAPRFGPVYGRRHTEYTEDWEFARVTATRVFVIHISNAEGDRLEERSATHARWTLEYLRKRRREVFPEGVVTLTTGYIEGWLPNGPISLF